MRPQKYSRDTSWQPVSSWYDKSVGSSGHFYHQHVVLPNVLKLLQLKNDSSLLDLACGQGILSRRIPKSCIYLGVDAAPDLIKRAIAQNKNSEDSQNRQFIFNDVTKPLPKNVSTTFSHATIILALQNIANPQAAITTMGNHLKSGGKAVIVLNHPYFRIPRHSSWGVDESNKLQYRRINRYMSSLKIPITAHPGQKNSPVTWSFHEPLQNYIQYLHKAGFVITDIQEWTSPKQSVGTAAAMENRSRDEFPLFMCLVAKKQ